MNIKRLLVLSALPILIGGFGFTVPSNAQAKQSTLLAQNSSQPTGQRQGWGRKFDQLNLTDAQKTQLQQIKASTRQQIDAVFTAEQKQQLQAARQQRQKPNLNLTDDQKARLKSIRDSAKTQMDAVLTASQKQQLEQLRQQWRQNRQKPQS